MNIFTDCLADVEQFEHQISLVVLVEEMFDPNPAIFYVASNITPA